jgi:hemerythrin-like domain-containing protein
MKATALLLEDHKEIRRVAEILEEIARRAKHGQASEAQDVKTLLAFLESFGDRFHQEREESFLFPSLLRDRGQKNYSKLRRLSFEHERQRYLIQGLRESTLTTNARDLVFCATRLAEVLREHLAEEESALFPLADSTLSPAEDQQLAEWMQE